jgi:hypothetical protein
MIVIDYDYKLQISTLDAETNFGNQQVRRDNLRVKVLTRHLDCVSAPKPRMKALPLNHQTP